jgi:GDP/UDP-N,N'-diacetylbacillosamine 2-epimerase (hydrolysing)
MRKKVCVITGSRAEYGLLQPLIRELKQNVFFDTRLIVTGMHLSRVFGLTYREIEKDGFHIDRKIDLGLTSDSAVTISKATGRAVELFGRAYRDFAPDTIIVIGDRFEIFGAVAAAYITGRVTIAHLYGGELTEAAFDDGFRHSITKMSHLHFTSTNEYRKRIIQLGEQPSSIFVVGALGLDNIKKLKLLPKQELENSLQFTFGPHNLLVTFHPVTLEPGLSSKTFSNLLKVLDSLSNSHIIFTKANADPDGRMINKMIDLYVAKHPQKAIAFKSMGQVRYLSAMRFVDAVVGNSSSGIIEAPSFKIGTINIGERQKGRIKAKSIIDCEPTRHAITNAFRKLYSRKFQKALKKVRSPYGNGNSAEKIVRVLERHLNRYLLKKVFYNIKRR